MTSPQLFDAHNHLQDPLLQPGLDDTVRLLIASGAAGVVANGTQEQDWPLVAELARRYPDFVFPAFGLHPWHVASRSSSWLSALESHLALPNASVGEIGLDRWVANADPKQQEEVFLSQWHLACRLGRAVSIHCLKAWGKLEEILRRESRAPRGFLLHSYGGPVEMVDSFARLGGFFSCSGYFGHHRKQRQRDTFLEIPLDRLLIETDAPDMLPPDSLILQPAAGPDGRPFNHPLNLPAAYRFVAGLKKVPVEELATRVAANFKTLFGPAEETE